MTRLSRWFLVGYMLFLVVAFAMQSRVYLAAYLGLCVPFALAQLDRIRRATSAELLLVVLALIGPASLLVVSVLRLGPAALFHFVVGASAVITAWAATRDADSYLLASRTTLVLSQSVVLAYLSVVGIADFPLDRMIGDHSSNGITSYLIVLQLNYCLANFLLRRRFSWYTQVVTLLICIVGFGRGSLLAIGSLVLVSLAMLSLPGSGQSRLGRYALFAVAIVAVLGSTDQIRLFAEANTKVGAGFQDQSRQRMMADYLDMDATSAIVGRTFEKTSIERLYNNNPHNSFIRAHHIFGLGYLLIVALFPAYVVIRSRAPLTGRVYSLLLMLILYTRIFTEPVLFPTVFDFFFFGMCFVSLKGGGDQVDVASPDVPPLGAMAPAS